MSTPSKHPLDREKLRAFTRKLRRKDLLQLLDRAMDLLPASRLPRLIKGFAKPEAFVLDGAAGDLLDQVNRFRDSSLRGDYYEAFEVNWRNSEELSRGTENWIAGCKSLLERCVKAAKKAPGAEVCKGFEVLFDLLRRMAHGDPEMLFFADEGGSWLLGVDWDEVLPAYFRTLTASADPEAYSTTVLRTVDTVLPQNRDRYLRFARRLARPEQRAALMEKARAHSAGERD